MCIKFAKRRKVSFDVTSQTCQHHFDLSDVQDAFFFLAPWKFAAGAAGCVDFKRFKKTSESYSPSSV